MKVSTKALSFIFATGTVLIALGLTVALLWSSIYQWILNTQLSLSPSSVSYKMWKETPIPMYLKVYMFNWTNPEEFSSTSSVKPNFMEMGPYVFRQVDYKVSQVWNQNDTITYQRKRIWHFDESLSNGSLSDRITNLNPVAATVAYTLRYKDNIVRDIADRVMTILEHKIIMKKTVGELLFDGYDDKMLLIARKLKLSKIPFTKFGWFYGRNGSETYDGTFNMLTGANNLFDTGMLKEWNFNSQTENFYGECGKIIGTNGDLWPPLPDNQTVSIFVSDICTDLKLRYDNTSTHQGLIGSKYVSDETMLDNGTLIPSRQCYCHETECMPTGMLNVSTCKYGAPAFVSLPHFYLADESYREAVTGMTPDKEKHEMFLVVEPNTGIPLQVKAQLQINMLIQPDDQMKLFKNVPRTVVPMFWFAQEANLTSNYAGTVKFILTLPSLGLVTFFGIAAFGILIFTFAFFLCIRQSWQGEEGQVLLPRNGNFDITRSSG